MHFHFKVNASNFIYILINLLSHSNIKWCNQIKTSLIYSFKIKFKDFIKPEPTLDICSFSSYTLSLHCCFFLSACLNNTQPKFSAYLHGNILMYLFFLLFSGSCPLTQEFASDMSALNVANNWYSLPSLVGVSSISAQYSGNFFKRTGWGRTVACLSFVNNFGGLHKIKQVWPRA